jgi:transposase
MRWGASPAAPAESEATTTFVEFADDHGFRAAARHFGLARVDGADLVSMVGSWRRSGTHTPPSGAAPPACVSEGIVEWARVARTEHRWGATRTRIWLERVHQIRVNAKTIQRVFCDLGLPALTKTPKRKPKQLKRSKKTRPETRFRSM